MRSPRHEEALRYAADGIPVFPCQVNSKEPATAHGYKDATTNPEIINGWWSKEDYNPAICPEDAGWAVIDPDCKHGKRGLETWDNLCREFGKRETTCVRTPTGGRHFYFRGSIASTTGTATRGLGLDVDTRGRGGYVLIPPSVIDGVEYQWTNDLPTADLPKWITEKLAQSAQTVTEAAVDELDLPANIARAEARLRDLVAQGDIAIEGQGGDDRTYRLATEMLELGLSPETTLDLMDKLWNTHCLPPWDRDELGVKIENASRYAQNAAGAFAVVTAQEAFGHAIESLTAKAPQQSPQQSPQPRFPLIHISKFNTEFNEPNWLIPDLLPAKGIVQIIGQRKSFKSFLALDLSLGLSSATETFGFKSEKQIPVVYCVGENANSFARRHVTAWLTAKQRERDFPFWVTPRVPRAAENGAQDLIDAIMAAGIHPGLVVIDTATRALRGLETNSEKDVGMFSQACDNIRDALGCTVIPIRHVGKNQERGSRGSGALDDDADTNLLVERHEKSPAVKLTVIDQRNAEERAEPWFFEARPVAGLSLVFNPITAQEYQQYTGAENALDRRKIGAALTKLGAIGREKAVLSPVLAAELLPASQTQSTEERQAAIGRLCRALGSLAKTTLLAYAEREGRDIFWFMPDQSSVK